MTKDYLPPYELRKLFAERDKLKSERDALLAERGNLMGQELVGYVHPLDIEKIKTHSYSQVSLRNRQDGSYSVGLYFHQQEALSLPSSY